MIATPFVAYQYFGMCPMLELRSLGIPEEVYASRNDGTSNTPYFVIDL